MSTNAYHQVALRRSLLRAWQELYAATRKRSRNTPGVDGVTINSYAADGMANVQRLARELRAGRFAFDDLRPYFVPKPNGKTRLICVPMVKDRIVQRALLAHLYRSAHQLTDNEVSYGFVRGRTVDRAAKRAIELRQQSPWVLKTDICSFFDRVDRHQLIAELRRLIRERSLHALLIAAVQCEVRLARERDLYRLHKLGIRLGRGIRQGMPLSPFFSNVMLRDFDAAVIKSGIKAVRYADDLIVFGNSASECERLFAFCKGELGKLGLELPEPGVGSKTEIVPPSKPVEFLGLGMCPTANGAELRVMPPQIAHIRSELLSLSNIAELNARQITFASIGSALRNRVNGYLSAYECCTNVHELAQNLADVEQKTLRGIYTSLGIPISKLSAAQRAFLQLAP